MSSVGPARRHRTEKRNRYSRRVPLSRLSVARHWRPARCVRSWSVALVSSSYGRSLKVAQPPIRDSPGRSMKILERSSSRWRVHSLLGTHGHSAGSSGTPGTPPPPLYRTTASRCTRELGRCCDTYPLWAILAAVFPHAPQRRRLATSHVAARVGKRNSIGNPPFVLVGERIGPGGDRRLCCAENRTLQHVIRILPDAQAQRSVTTAPSLQADSDVTPQRLFRVESPGRVQIHEQRYGPDPGDARHFRESPHLRILPPEACQLRAHHGDLPLYHIVRPPQQPHLSPENRGAQAPQQRGAVRLVHEILLVYEYSGAAKLTHDSIRLAYALPHPIVVQRRMPLKQHAFRRFSMVHSLDVSAAIQVRELFGVDRVILVRILRNQGIAARLAHHHLVYMIDQVTVQPVGQRPFLNRQEARPRHLFDRIDQCGDGGGATIALHHASAFGHRDQFTELAMRVHSYKMSWLHRGLLASGTSMRFATRASVYPTTSRTPRLHISSLLRYAAAEELCKGRA